jgi:predicted nucleotidyltransferase component of viral defense system
MLDIRTHKTILLQILKDVYTDISISSTLGFKGGTACYFFYDLPRFSIDLDFDLLDLNKEKIVFEKNKEILKNYGELKEARNKRYTLFFILSYSKEAQNIKIEISKRSFGSNYEIKNYLGISMLVMKKEDIFAHKLAAILDRKQLTNRDLFDTWFFLKNNWEINEKIIEKRTGMKLKDYLKKCQKKIEKANKGHILAGVGELLDEKTKNWAKENLKKDLLFLLELKLVP